MLKQRVNQLIFQSKWNEQIKT